MWNEEKKMEAKKKKRKERKMRNEVLSKYDSVTY